MDSLTLTMGSKFKVKGVPGSADALVLVMKGVKVILTGSELAELQQVIAEAVAQLSSHKRLPDITWAELTDDLEYPDTEGS